MRPSCRLELCGVDLIDRAEHRAVSSIRSTPAASECGRDGSGIRQFAVHLGTIGKRRTQHVRRSARGLNARPASATVRPRIAACLLGRRSADTLDRFLRHEVAFAQLARARASRATALATSQTRARGHARSALLAGNPFARNKASFQSVSSTCPRAPVPSRTFISRCAACRGAASPGGSGNRARARIRHVCSTGGIGLATAMPRLGRVT